MKVLAVYNIKGGVGKTASAVNLAYVAASEGYRTLLWDLDPQGAASFYFRVKPKVKGGGLALLNRKRQLDDVVKETDFEGLDLVPADFSYRNMDIALDGTKRPLRQLRKLIKPLRQRYDYLFLDCAPSVSLVSENVFQAADALLIPLIPTTLSLRTYQQLVRHLEGSGLKNTTRIPFFSMVDHRKRMHRDFVEDLPRSYPEFLDVRIPYASQVEQMGLRREPVGSFAPDSLPGQVYRAAWEEVKTRL